MPGKRGNSFQLPEIRSVESVTYREFVEYAKDFVRKIGESFKDPEDDWEPVALIKGDEGIALVGLVLDKAHWPEVVSAIVKKTKATKVALITSSWGLEFTSSEEYDAYMADDDAPSPSKHPNGVKQVVVNVFDAERVEAWSAKILRDGEQPPVLGEWDWGGADPSGRMIDPIRAAMR